MFTRATAALVLLLSPLAATAQPSDRYPAHTVSFPGGVAGRPDIVYASYAGYHVLSLDLYEPPPQANPAR